MPVGSNLTAGKSGFTLDGTNSPTRIETGQNSLGVVGAATGIGGLQSNQGILYIDEQGKRRVQKTELGIACLQGISAVAGTAGAISAAAGPLGGIIGGSAGALTTMIQGGLTAYDSHSTAQKLEGVLKNNAGACQDLKDCITYIIGKRISKRDRNVANATVVAGIGVTFHNAGKALFKFAKQTKGVNREKNVDKLLSYADGRMGGSTDKRCANEAIVVLLGKGFHEHLKETLKNAMKST